MDDFSAKVPKALVNKVSLLLDSTSTVAASVNLNKWVLRVPAFERWEQFTLLCEIEAARAMLDEGLHAYVVYWYHCRDAVRPEKRSTALAVKGLFRRLFPQDFTQYHKHYLELLDAAYPETEE